MINPASVPLSKERVIDFTEQCLAAAEQELAGGQEESLTPTLYVLGRKWAAAGSLGKEEMHVFRLMIDFNEHAEKRNTVHQCGQETYQAMLIPQVCCMTTEVWRSPDSPGVEPRHHPQRTEGITAQSLAIDLTACLMHVPFTRENGKIRLGVREPPLTDGVRANLLKSFYLGFAADLVAKYGPNGPPQPQPCAK